MREEQLTAEQVAEAARAGNPNLCLHLDVDVDAILCAVTYCCLAECTAEWDEISVSFGAEFHDAGRKLLDITTIVLATPDKYKPTPGIDIRSTESRTFAEFLAFAEGYWFHVFVTEWRLPKPETIVTVSFTPHFSDRHATPPKDSENILLIDEFK